MARIFFSLLLLSAVVSSAMERTFPTLRKPDTANLTNQEVVLLCDMFEDLNVIEKEKYAAHVDAQIYSRKALDDFWNLHNNKADKIKNEQSLQRLKNSIDAKGSLKPGAKIAMSKYFSANTKSC